MTSYRQRNTSVALCVLVLGLGACRLDPYESPGPGRWLDAEPQRDVVVFSDAAVPDALTPDSCVPSMEVCDGVDNDCNGVVDDAPNLSHDVLNCGECGHQCSFAHALAACEAGQCVMGDCFSGYQDENGESFDGCEYSCVMSNGGVEACDGKDNNCNGEVDEGFDLTSDPHNCGSCGHWCIFLDGIGDCASSVCALVGCLGGFRDPDGIATNGCECRIQMSEDASGLTPCVEGADTCPPGEECADPDRDQQSHCLPIPLDTCDGRDNDCDGLVDEDATPCGP